MEYTIEKKKNTIGFCFQENHDSPLELEGTVHGYPVFRNMCDGIQLFVCQNVKLHVVFHGYLTQFHR